MIIKIYSDSLGFPRPEEGIEYAKTYAGKLSELTSNVILRGSSGISISRMHKVIQMDGRYTKNDVEFAIVHIGIVDSAPRPIPIQLRYLVNLLPGLIKNQIIKFLNRNRAYIQKIKIFRNTNPCKFKKKYSAILQELINEEITPICVGISCSRESVYNKSPGLRESILLYNDIIEEICKKNKIHYIKMDNYQFLLDDGIHINEMGHNYIKNSICEIVLSV